MEINEDEEDDEEEEEELKAPSQLDRSIMNEKQQPMLTSATRQQEGEQATDIDRQSSSKAPSQQNPKESKLVFDRLFN